MIFLTINLLFIAAESAISNYYYQSNKLLNEEILNLTQQVNRQSNLEELKIRLLLNSSISAVIKKIDKTTEAIDQTTKAIENTTKTLQQQNVYFFKAAAIQDQFRKNTTATVNHINDEIDHILANQIIIQTRINSIANNKTMSQTLNDVLIHQESLAKLLLNQNKTR